MISAYVRVSTDKQTVKNQRREIERFCSERGLKVERWVSETVSGAKPAGARQLGGLLRKMKRGDTLVCSELSRLGRRLMEVMGILNMLMARQVRVLTVKERYELAGNLQSQILAFAFGLAAQIERDLISQRTKEGLARIRAEGTRLGRRPGGHNTRYKLTGCEDSIRRMRDEGMSVAEMCRRLKCNRKTLERHVERMNMG